MWKSQLEKKLNIWVVQWKAQQTFHCLKNINNQFSMHRTVCDQTLWSIQLHKANLKGGQEETHLQQPENLERVKDPGCDDK